MKRLAALLLAIPLLVRPAAAHTPVIDAGHGGFDGGAVSSSGVIESGLNLSIALRTADAMRLFGIEPVLIRETDSALGEGSGRSAKSADLKRRVEIINSTDDAFLISIHQNMFGDSRYGGAHIFYKGEDARPLAEAIQADIRARSTGRACTYSRRRPVRGCSPSADFSQTRATSSCSGRTDIKRSSRLR